MSTQPLNHATGMLARIILQYRDSPKFKAWLEMWAARAQELEDALQQVATMSDIDQAFGHSLDVIGEHVDQPRILEGLLPLDVFGFEGQEGKFTYGDEDFPERGRRFFDEAIEDPFGSTVMDDPAYRAAIRLKIARNVAKGTCDDMIIAANAVLQQLAGIATPCYVEDTQSMTATLYIGKILTYREQALLKNFNFLPKPIGVRLIYFHFDSANYFGFEGQPGAQGLGDEDYPDRGGPFAEEF